MASMYGKYIYSVTTVLGIQIFRVVFGHHCRAGTMFFMFFKELILFFKEHLFSLIVLYILLLNKIL